MKITVKDRQTMLDIALQQTGSLENAFDLSAKNGISLTDELKDGQILNAVNIDNEKVVRRYQVKSIIPATAIDNETKSVYPGGIGYMAIEINFIVS